MKTPRFISFLKAHLDTLLFMTPALILALILAIAAKSAGMRRDPPSILANSPENSSVYYSSNTLSSQENASSAPVNSRNIKNYTIRLYENVIAIFENDCADPVYTLNINTSRLPKTDQILLESGIHADSLAEAYKLIEDYE